MLIRGQSGTGKDLVAQAIHARSNRCDNPFLALNCGAVSSELIGSELFGHERGSFTGANRQHLGYFERANGGTLFLDEITEMPLELQVQLLRVLETGKLMRIGGSQEIAVDVRIVTATNRDPLEAIQEGLFREDLYFRLAVFPIQMPSLNERTGDAGLIANFFLERLNQEEKTTKVFAPDVLPWLENRPWPGNVRELKNAVQRAFILAENEITQAHFAAFQPPVSLPESPQPAEQGNEDGNLHLTVGVTSMEEAERQLIFATLAYYEQNKSKAAEALGISLKTLYNRLKQYESEN
ncbi:MAG: sigma-54 dependent transcriptional regulator [Candidatus Competibacteraceae bacterium]